MKGQAITCHLAEKPVDGYQSMRDLFPDKSILRIETEEEHSSWNMYFDGAVNMHGNGIRAILISLTGAHYQVAIKLRDSFVPTVWPNMKLASLV